MRNAFALADLLAIIGIVTLLGLVGANSTTKPSREVRTFHAVEEIVALLPSKCVPDGGAKWTNVNLSVSTKWMQDHVAGDIVEIPVYLRNMQYIKEYKSRGERRPAKIRATAIYRPAPTKDNREKEMWEQRAIRYHRYSLGLGMTVEFPEKFVDVLAKVKPFDMNNGRGTKLTIKGRIEKIAFEASQSPVIVGRKSVYSDCGVDLHLVDCQIESR